MNTDRNKHSSRPDGGQRPQSRRNAGASLVEVLIVLVIILIGVFAVIQIFPIGFTTLKRSESRLRADRLARNMTETLNADTSTLPESITFSYFKTGSSGELETRTAVDPDDLSPFDADGDGVVEAGNKLYFSDVNKFRYVKNEPVRIPLASAVGGAGFGGGVGSVHFLTFGPVFMDATVGTPTNPTAPLSATDKALYNSYLKVTSEALSGSPYDSENGDAANATSAARRVTGANTYLIDYGDENSGSFILFAPSGKARTFIVEYSVEGTDTVNDRQITIPQTQTFLVAANETPVWKPFAPVASTGTTVTTQLVPGTERVTRDFTRLASTDVWDPTEPYQYKLVSSNVATNANLGVIAFNPAGANFSISIPGGTKPFTALVSYAVLDWHILRDDREVPASGKVRTTLPDIRVRGEDFVDLNETGANRNQVYGGLYPTAVYNNVAAIPPASDSPDIQVFNLSDDTGTARLLVAGDLANQTADLAKTVDMQPDYWINRAGRGGTYPTGTIYVNTNRVAVGSKVRILYKAKGDWAVAFQKAAKSYRNEETGGRPVAGKAEVFAIDRAGTADPKDDKIYFHRSETNKSVTVAAEVQDSSGARRRLPARQFSIASVEGNYAYASALDVFPELQTGVSDWRVVGDINGASLKTRVIWQDEQNGRNPWRISDMETFVTRQAQ